MKPRKPPFLCHRRKGTMALAWRSLRTLSATALDKALLSTLLVLRAHAPPRAFFPGIHETQCEV